MLLNLLKPLPPTDLILQAWLVFDQIFLHLRRFELHSFSQTFIVQVKTVKHKLQANQESFTSKQNK